MKTKSTLIVLFCASQLLFSSCLKKEFKCDCVDIYSGTSYHIKVRAKNNVEAHSTCEDMSGGGQHCSYDTGL